MLASLEGLDHVVVMVHDLDAAADRWRALGFTLSPRGTHSAHLGTGNYTIMFGTDYVELLGVLQGTALNAPSRGFLQRRGEGIERAAFTTRNAAEGVAAQLASLLLTQAEAIADGVRVRSAPGRGDFVFLTPEAFQARHPSARQAQPATEGVAALVCAVTDLDAAARCAGAQGERSATAVSVPAEHANGVMLVFEAA